MLYSNIFTLASIAGVASANAVLPGMMDSQRHPYPSRFIEKRQNNDTGLQLLQANVQTGSQQNGQDGGDDGQALSDTSNNNFINFCSGKDLTNGLQKTGGSCNGIPMGDIPAESNMVSAIITSPQPGEDIAPNTDFDVTLTVANLDAGSFTNPDTTYYSAPQTLGSSGNVIGHAHVTIQDLGGSLTPNGPPAANDFAFFKGINDAGDGAGNLKVTVTGGLDPGFYRACTINSASNHQAVTMPIAQRGAQDDCQKFTVGQGNGNAGGGGNGTKLIRSRYVDSYNAQRRSVSDRSKRFSARAWVN